VRAQENRAPRLVKPFRKERGVENRLKGIAFQNPLVWIQSKGIFPLEQK
jgi:hypothetical protein